MRRKRHEEHLNHEAWAIPYADLMTLLLAFFVVMYAVSVVNEGKYRVASESMVEAFNGGSRTSVPLVPSEAPPPPSPPSASRPTSASGAPLSVVPQPSQPAPPAAAQGRAASDLQRIEDQVRKALQPLIDRQMVKVHRGPNALEIEIRTDVLFPSGVAQLSAPASEVLRNMATILAPFGNALRVEGFTDDVPIATSMYPSNWELSAARAATVARLFAVHGVRPDRLGIVGWGEVRPIADNATVDGRNQNRRVLVVVMGEQAPIARAPQGVDRLAEALQMTTTATPSLEDADAGKTTAGPGGVDAVAPIAAVVAAARTQVQNDASPTPGIAAVVTAPQVNAPLPAASRAHADVAR